MSVAPPVFVIAPAQRCGSTLLQRLLTSSRDVLVFGENFVMAEQLPAMVHGAQQQQAQKQRNAGAALARATAGETSFDMSVVFPDYNAYVGHLHACLGRLMAFYSDEARRAGFARWGLKSQVRNPVGARALTQVCPEARVVFVYRDPMAVARSAAARWPAQYHEPAAFARLGRQWAAGVQAFLNQQPANVMLVCYERLTGDAQPEVLADILAFTRVNDVDESVLGRRINVSETLDPLAPAEREALYRPPTEIGPEAEAAVAEAVRDTAEKLGYEIPAPAFE